MTAVQYEESQTELEVSERKFRSACTQINILNKQLEEVKARYQQAKLDNFHRFRYNLRLKLAVVEGVRNMYYEYAHVQAEEVARLRYRIYGEVITVSSGQ